MAILIYFQQYYLIDPVCLNKKEVIVQFHNFKYKASMDVK